MRSKARLTITLSRELLEQLDRMIDREAVRNRSHAIEMLIRQSLTPTVPTAVILAGGESKGVEIPALANMQGRKLIHIIVHHLLDFGISSFVILAGKHRAQFEAVVGRGRDIGASITYISEENPLGTAGVLKEAEPYLPDAPFLVVHGDILTDINITDFINFHRDENRLATIAVKPRNAERKYGKVMLQGNKITHFFEKDQSEGISIVNTGVYLFNPDVLSLIEKGKPAKLESDVFPKLAEMGELSAFLFQGIWFDISTPENYRLAQERWKDKRDNNNVSEK